jgi:hypothetical protein
LLAIDFARKMQANVAQLHTAEASMQSHFNSVAYWSQVVKTLTDGECANGVATSGQLGTGDDLRPKDVALSLDG